MNFDTLIVPADCFSPGEPDEQFAPEAKAAKELGLRVVYLNQQELDQGHVKLRGELGELSLYRGWMLSADIYAKLTEAIQEVGSSPVTMLPEYQNAHELPGRIDKFAQVTPRTIVTRGTDNIDALLGQFSGPVIVKDYVKSEKHHWDEACFIPEAEDTEHARQVIEKFIELRGPGLQGGLVLREFEQFQGAEVRAWWVDSKCVLVSAHPDTPDEFPEDLPREGLGQIEEAAQNLHLPFITIDLAHSDLGWRVIEVGDGQVSDRPVSQDAKEFLEALLG